MKVKVNKDIAKKGRYSYNKGTELTVIARKPILTLIEDGLGFQHWVTNIDLDLIEEDEKDTAVFWWNGLSHQEKIIELDRREQWEDRGIHSLSENEILDVFSCRINK